MTDTECQALQDEHAACMARATAIAAQLARRASTPPGYDSLPSRDEYETLATMAGMWGISIDGARKRAKLLKKRNPILATKLGAGRWLVHRSVLLPSASEYPE